MGADYDPQIRELHMHSQVSLDWRGKTPDSAPMHIESGEAYYKEKESKVLLLPWSKLKRDTLTMEGAMAVVVLDEGEVREATLMQGRGIRDESDRQVEFGADQLHLHFVDVVAHDRIADENESGLIVECLRVEREGPHKVVLALVAYDPTDIQPITRAKRRIHGTIRELRVVDSHRHDFDASEPYGEHLSPVVVRISYSDDRAPG